MTQAHPRTLFRFPLRSQSMLRAAGTLAIACALSACASQPGPWPAGALPPAAAVTVDATQFLSTKQLVEWQADLDARGLRATGSAQHEAYIDALHERLARAGVKQLRYETVRFPQWSVAPGNWKLQLADDDQGQGAAMLATAGYIPYSGVTPPSGIVAPMVYLAPGSLPNPSLAGKLVLVDVPKVALTGKFFHQSAVHVHDPDNAMAPDTPYARSFQMLGPLVTLLERLQAAGAAGVIAILDEPAATAHGLYAPYDRELRQLPGVFVDRDMGKRLRALALAGTAPALRLTMDAKVQQVQTRNLIGIIPGKSEQLTVVNSHTDGTNGLEDNGPNAIVDMAQYLARLPQESLPRSIMLMLSSGHFAGGVGIEHFLESHKDDGLTQRIAAIVTIEHLGAQEWLPDSNGLLRPTGKAEPAGMFSPRTPALMDASYAMLKHANAAPAFVMPPTNPKGDGSANNAVWPGEGQYFWGLQRIPTINYITGPNYLLNYGVTTTDKVDFARLQRETAAFTQLLLDLSRVPYADLRQEMPALP